MLELSLLLVLGELEREIGQVRSDNVLSGLLRLDDGFIGAYAVQSISHDSINYIKSKEILIRIINKLFTKTFITLTVRIHYKHYQKRVP